jgi:hypothetical protein
LPYGSLVWTKTLRKSQLVRRHEKDFDQTLS